MTSNQSPKSSASQPTRIIAIANQKGGVGKTTTAINIGAALAIGGKRTLLIDLDPQGNASTGVGIDPAHRANGTHAFLFGAAIEKVVRTTDVPNLSVIPADAALVGADMDLVDHPERATVLREAIARHAGDYDLILLDCPPSLGLLNLNGLAAADSVLVPLQCEFFALEGISQLMRTVDQVRDTINPHLRVNGIVLTMFDRRNNLSTLVADDVRAFFGDTVFQTMIPRNVRISEAPSHGKPVMLYDFRSPGAQAYLQLAQEFSNRNLPAAGAA